MSGLYNKQQCCEVLTTSQNQRPRLWFSGSVHRGRLTDDSPMGVIGEPVGWEVFANRSPAPLGWGGGGGPQPGISPGGCESFLKTMDQRARLPPNGEIRYNGPLVEVLLDTR